MDGDLRKSKGEREQTLAFILSLLPDFGQNVTSWASIVAVIISRHDRLYPGPVSQIKPFLRCLVRHFVSAVRTLTNASTYPLKKVLPFSK